MCIPLAEISLIVHAQTKRNDRGPCTRPDSKRICYLINCSSAISCSCDSRISFTNYNARASKMNQYQHIIHIYIYIYIHTYTYVYIYIYCHAHIYICTYVCNCTSASRGVSKLWDICFTGSPRNLIVLGSPVNKYNSCMPYK